MEQWKLLGQHGTRVPVLQYHGLPTHPETTAHVSIQWNFSNPDTNGEEESVLVSEVYSLQGLICIQEWYLGWEKVSCLESSPRFRGVLTTVIDLETVVLACVSPGLPMSNVDMTVACLTDRTCVKSAGHSAAAVIHY